MKFATVSLALLFGSSNAFVAPRYSTTTRSCSSSLLKMSSPLDEERMKKILQEEAMNPANMAASAAQMQNMKPGDMDAMLDELDGMTGPQLDQLKSMGMDPNMMKTSMKMMRDNPAMMSSVGKMMESMTPEQMLEKSKQAQEAMANLSEDQVQQAAAVATTMSEDQLGKAAEAVVEAVSENDDEPKSSEGSSITADPDVLDTMYKVAELMSNPPTGKVTFSGFSSLPPITLLSGNREEDLSRKELGECWADGSLGSTRVDRVGFERVWNEVQEYFEEDMMDEARRTSTKSRSSTAVTAATPVAPTPVVGTQVDPDVLANQVKNMSDGDMDFMLDQMNQMTPQQEASMKAMGVDPRMMQKTADMMKNNPLMKKAAIAMMKNMSPDQMMKASQQAQKQMGNMSQEDMDKAMDALNKGK